MSKRIWQIEESSGDLKVGEDLGDLILAIGCGELRSEGWIVFYEAGILNKWQGLMDVSASEVVLLSHPRGDWHVREREVWCLEAKFGVMMSQKQHTIRCVPEKRTAEAIAALPARLN